MRFLSRWLILILLVVSATGAAVAQNYSPATGEIRFDGTVASYDEAQKKLVINVASFTLPNGKTSRLAEAKPKNVVLNAQTKSEIFGSKETSLSAVLLGGATVAVIGQDSGSGKDVTARLVLVKVEAEPAVVAPAADADPNDVGLRVGETRFDARITGILSPTNITVSVSGKSNAAGEMEEIFPTQTKTLILDDKTVLRSRADAARKMAFGDLQIGTRVSFAGADGGMNVKTREVAIWEVNESSSETVGTVSVSGPVSALLGRAEQAHEARAYEEAVRLYNRAVQTADGVGDRSGKALTLSRLGSLYDDMNQPQKALELMLAAQAIWRALNNASSEGSTLNNMGLLLGKMGQNDKAVEALERSLQLSRGGNPRGTLLTLFNLSSAYATVEKYDKALPTALEALSLVKQGKKDVEFEASILAQIIQLYGVTSNAPKALEYAGQALVLLDQLNDKPARAYLLRVAASAHAGAGQKPKAQELYRQAQAIYVELGEKEQADKIAEVIAKM